MNSYGKFIFIFVMLFTLIFVTTGRASACFQQEPAQEEDESKGLMPKSFVANRPAPKKERVSKPRPVQTKKVVYRRISKPLNKPKAAKTEMASIGFTVWKRKPMNLNNTKGIAENRAGAAQISVPEYERVNSETPLAVGENIQITIESLTHKGFLYIIDREKYADGTYSTPKIIYPLRGRGNYVNPGILKSTGVFDIVAPALNKQQVEEVFTVIISPNALVPAERLLGGIIEFEPSKFNEWANKWNAEVEVIEQETGAGEIMTDEETKGIQENRQLTQDDPAPLTVYRSYINRGDAILMNFHLKFKSA